MRIRRKKNTYKSVHLMHVYIEHQLNLSQLFLCKNQTKINIAPIYLTNFVVQNILNNAFHLHI